jgi:3',5'-cyclic AMP phosphodiesterase CpdA
MFISAQQRRTMVMQSKTIPVLIALLLAAPTGFSARSAQEPDPGSVVFVGAGDIANCDLLGGARSTAALLDDIKGEVFTLGDHAYLRGTDAEFKKCYDSTWGKQKARTHPTPGNHDYLTNRARPYFDYFGDAAGPERRGYYSFDLGAWHILSLNSSVPSNISEQAKWLRADLAAHPNNCTLAYWHAPLFSSGPHSGESTMREIWSILYKAGADVVLSGHDHIYERFAPQDDKGQKDPEHGIREFIVGTGGGGVYKFGSIAPNSEVRDNTTYGVLKLTLSPGRYAWEFVGVPGSRFKDSGEGMCTPAK